VSETSQFGLTLLSWLLLACATGVPTLILWMRFIRPSKILPPQRQRRVGWTGGEVLVAFFMVQLFMPALAVGMLGSIPIYRLVYGEGFLPEENTILHGMWVNVLAAPFSIAGVLLLFRFTSDTRPYQLGISLHNLARGTVLGWLAWLIMSPAVFGLHMIVQILYQSSTGNLPEQHSLTRMAMGSSNLLDWVLIVGSAVVIAPVKEELLFRGVAQSWLSRRPWGGHIAMFAAFLIAIVERYDKIHAAVANHSFAEVMHQLQPALFVLALLPVYWLIPRLLGRWFAVPAVPRGIFGASLVFAVFHSTVWPTPIPLFFLGLGLGFLAYRTQSLTASIVLHSMFNAISCLALALMRT
jgi:membrane protease YdiL (CAAX protease family)